MDIHPKFPTWLASANITPNDETLRKWWTGLAAFEASASDVVSLVQLANEADAATVSSSRFHAALQKQDAALLPSHKLAVAALAAAKLNTIIEANSTLSDLAALLSAISFPIFETQSPYRADLALIAETYLADSSRGRADLATLVKEIEDGDEEFDSDELRRILAVTAEETNILWWIFGGHSRDNNGAFADIAEEVIPFVAAKELADLTTLFPGHVAVEAFADRVCRIDRAKPVQSLAVTNAIKKLPEAFVENISTRWTDRSCLSLCRLTREITGQASGWGKSHKLRTVNLSQLFYRECLVPQTWKKASS